MTTTRGSSSGRAWPYGGLMIGSCPTLQRFFSFTPPRPVTRKDPGSAILVSSQNPEGSTSRPLCGLFLLPGVPSLFMETVLSSGKMAQTTPSGSRPATVMMGGFLGALKAGLGIFSCLCWFPGRAEDPFLTL